MPKRSNLERLKTAALRGDWKSASDAYLELAFELMESGEQQDISTLEWALRLRKAETAAAIVDEMLGDGGSNPHGRAEWEG